MDAMVLATQQWLNKEYKGKPGWVEIPETGVTGWTTVYALLHAFQIESGSSAPSDNIGSWTVSAINAHGLLKKDTSAAANNFVRILQGTLWCKGYPADAVSGVFGSQTESGVKSLQADIGLATQDGIMTLNLWYSLFSMDQYVRVRGGKDYIRAFQQNFNRNYMPYYGKYVPCDGLAGRELYTCFVLMLQMEEGYNSEQATGSFGTQTYNNCPTLSASNASSYPETMKCIKIALNLAMSCNLTINATLDSTTLNYAKQFCTFMCLPVPYSYAISKGTIKSLFTSNGDEYRSAKACDMATPITESIANSLVNAGYKAVGRYLTAGKINGVNKQLTKTEIALLKRKNISIIPIYQTSGNYTSYFTYIQGLKDAYDAVKSAYNFGITAYTAIYFAVDADVLGGDIPSTVLEYFRGVHEIVSTSVYRVGVYGTRNVCNQVADAGYAEYSYLSDMSYGFSGNLGFNAPSNWSFDQFANTMLGNVEIDKVAYRYGETGIGDTGMESVPSYEAACYQLVYDTVNRFGLLPATLKADFKLGKPATFSIAPWVKVEVSSKIEPSFSSNCAIVNIVNGQIVEFEKIKAYMRGIKAISTSYITDMEEFLANTAVSGNYEQLGVQFMIWPGNPSTATITFSFSTTCLECKDENGVNTEVKYCVEIKFSFTSFNNFAFETIAVTEEIPVLVVCLAIGILLAPGIIYTAPIIGGAITSIGSAIAMAPELTSEGIKAIQSMFQKLAEAF